MGFLVKYLKKFWKLFFTAILFLLIEATCDLLQPAIMSKIVDVGVAQKDMRYVINMTMVMLMVTGAGATGAFFRNILSNKVSQRFGADLRSDLFKKIQSLSFDNLDKFESSSLITRLTNDVTHIQNFIMGTMRIFVRAPLLAIGSIIMAFLLNARVAMILVIIVPIVGTLIFLSTKIGYPLFRKVQKTIDKINAISGEYLSGIRVVKAFNRFDYEVDRFGKANREMATVSATALRVMAVFSPGISLTVNIGIIMVLWLGGTRVNLGQMHVGQIIAFTNYLTQILMSLTMISMIFNAFVRARASSERVAEVLNEENTMPSARSSVKAASLNVTVTFENVSFSYKGAHGEPVLRNINLECRPGETTGIIGSTGSGKTSMVNLIPRFYDVTSGSVKIGSTDVREMDLKDLRNKIAIVPQKSVLFTGTIIDNIKWGKENANGAEVERAARLAHAHDFIAAFPEGYSTILGQGGVNLSGGQKQRISIARAIIREPEILIMDDSTSAVDMVTEAQIREELKTHLKHMTCFIVAQRITSVMYTDRIIVLDNGVIVGMGKHDELIQSCDVYRDIFRSQIGKEGITNGRTAKA
ncbi:MAG: ABC transporter [Clostridiales bacterium GWC2_40_7]|nr:MAG: ABC transporter [Clostridiales bacterium GWC2_40_7]